MKFFEVIKEPNYWKHTLRLAIMFFVLLAIISLLFNSFSDILKFDLGAVIEKNFSNDKWRQFVFTKFGISLLYSMFVIWKKLHNNGT